MAKACNPALGNKKIEGKEERRGKRGGKGKGEEGKGEERR